MLNIRPQYQKTLRYNVYARMGVNEDWHLVESNVSKDKIRERCLYYSKTWRIIKFNLI